MNVLLMMDELKNTVSKSVLNAGIFVLMLMLLAGCANNRSQYAPALEEGDIGYTESRLGSDRYRVVYRGDAGTPLETVQDYALLRAAELTVAQNYDWFEVAERTAMPEVEANNTARAGVQVTTGTTRQTRCGLIGCTTTETVAAPAFPQSEVDFPPRESNYVASLEVFMGEGNHARSADIYDARELIASIRAKF